MMLGLTCNERCSRVFELVANPLGELQRARGQLIHFQAKGVEGVSKLASNEETIRGQIEGHRLLMRRGL